MTGKSLKFSNFSVISSFTDNPSDPISVACVSRMTVPPPPPPPGGGPPPIPKSVTERKPIETAEIGDPGKIAKTGLLTLKLVRIEHQHGFFYSV